MDKTYELKLKEQIERYERLLEKKMKEVESIKFVIEVTQKQLERNGGCKDERCIQAELDRE